MKKAIVLFFAAASIVALVSCGSHSEGTETKTDSTAVAPVKADSASAVADTAKKDTTAVK